VKNSFTLEAQRREKPKARRSGQLISLRLAVFLFFAPPA
jgi:hypothetical protein